MLGTHVKDFFNLVEVGERIDFDIREGKLTVTQDDISKNQGTRKKEGKVSYVQSTKPPPPRQFVRSQGKQQWPNFNSTNAEIYESLLEAQLLAPLPVKPFQHHTLWGMTPTPAASAT